MAPPQAKITSPAREWAYRASGPDFMKLNPFRLTQTIPIIVAMVVTEKMRATKTTIRVLN